MECRHGFHPTSCGYCVLGISEQTEDYETKLERTIVRAEWSESTDAIMLASEIRRLRRELAEAKLEKVETTKRYYVTVMGYLTRYGNERVMDLTEGEASGIKKLAEFTQGWPKVYIREYRP